MSDRSTARGRAAKRQDPPLVEIKGDPAFFRRINYLAVLVGFLVAAAVYVGVGFAIQAVGLVTVHDSVNVQDGVYSSVDFLALFCGGLAAGMIEPKYGVLNGPLVAVIFILVGLFLTFRSELDLVKVVGPLGLGPMRVDRVFLTDIPQLFFASLGGMVAGFIDQRFGSRAAADRAARESGRR
jgi:hypothetical protein